MEFRRYYTYVLVDPSTGRIFYVGKGSSDRMYRHEKKIFRGGSTENHHLDNTIKRVHKNGERVIHRKIISNVTEDEAFEREKQLIAQLGMDNLCNYTEGGDGYSPTPETRAKISAANKGKIRTKEQCRKLSQLKKGTKMSNEFCQRQSVLKKGKPQTEKQKAANASRSKKMKGRKFSEEHKAKLRAAKLRNPVRYWEGKTIPESMRSKISQTLRERHERDG